ncbi:hypothetical protein [Burkholderia seminalis]|uniref:hypothetical protein n=1 Tax=Burkholderia seminalis TaxID=488731 RepID=UPI0019067F7D|nr:hypothetical protein [Burkholderia seminalis]MBJ9593241.1 hypothetical protein [Burkholderia seminalis]
MKKLVAMMMLSTAIAPSFAETIYTTVGMPASCVGQRFNVSEANDVLYSSRPCKLPIVNSKNMRQYTFAAQGMSWDGCWANLLGNRVSLISSDGSEDVRSKLEFVVSELNRSGVAVVVKSSAEEMSASHGEKLCN